MVTEHVGVQFEPISLCRSFVDTERVSLEDEKLARTRGALDVVV